MRRLLKGDTMTNDDIKNMRSIFFQLQMTVEEIDKVLSDLEDNIKAATKWLDYMEEENDN